MEILCCDLAFSSMLVFGGGDCNQVVRTNQRVFQNSRKRGLSPRGVGVQGDSGLVEHRHRRCALWLLCLSQVLNLLFCP